MAWAMHMAAALLGASCINFTLTKALSVGCGSCKEAENTTFYCWALNAGVLRPCASSGCMCLCDMVHVAFKNPAL